MNLGIMKRRAAQKYLPYDTEVEYLQSDGRQYIDCEVGIIYNADIVDIKTNVAFTKITSRQLNGTNGYFFWGISANRKFEFSGTEIPYNANFNIWNMHCEPNTKLKLSMNGVEYNSSSYPGDNPYLYAIYLFALGGRNNAAASFFTSQKQSDATITKNGVLVRDYIPVRVGQVGYLYDKVSDRLFADKSGVGFILGPDK